MITRAFSILHCCVPNLIVAFQLVQNARLLPGLRHYQLYSKFSNYTYVMEQSMKPRECQLAKTMAEWSFSSNSLLSLPLDPIGENYVRRNVPKAVFSKVVPSPLEKNLQLVAFSEDVLVNILDMDPAIASTEEFSQFIAGDKILPSCIPLAHRYGGHQFGVWAQQLGDGRAILLGEYHNKYIY